MILFAFYIYYHIFMLPHSKYKITNVFIEREQCYGIGWHLTSQMWKVQGHRDVSKQGLKCKFPFSLSSLL